MSKLAQPWMKFYPQDWRSDEKLRMCSLAARGLWIEMLAIMHRSERYGQLLVNGVVPTDVQLAVLAGASPDQVTPLLSELETAGVFSRNAGGAIYSRRMTRDQKKAENARKNGKNGGNPSLRKQTGNPASVNPKDKPPDKATDKLRGQRPEARGQKEEESARLSPDTARAPASNSPGAGIEGFETMARQLAQAISLTRPVSQRDREQLRAWLDDGLHFEFIVLEAGKQVAAREISRGRGISGFRYLDGRVREYAVEWHNELERLKSIRVIQGGKA